MDTSEALDLSKENIQPLKQGRNVVKLGTALQAQTDAEIQQQLLAEREKFELLIRMYEGDDPLQPHYEYVKWTEQTFPKHGPNSNIEKILENALGAFKDDPRYKQDVRYAELLVKFIDSQPNPLEVYQIAYDQGLCTMCALFYKAWADELDKINDFKTADQIYNLGIRVRAEPVDLLKEAHLLFQASVGRRMLGLGGSNDEEADPDYNRQALHKLQKRNVHSHRAPTGAPGQVKQHTSALSNKNNTGNATFKIYEGDDTDMAGHGDRKGKCLPKHSVVSKENTLKAGPWSQQGGKYRSKHQPTTPTTPSFKVHEDEGADINSGHHHMSSVPRALKTLKKDDFTCPLAVFEPPDPTKCPMYCKNKVYAGGREFQFEELRAAIYNRRYEQMVVKKVQEELEEEMQIVATPRKETSELTAESEAPPKPLISATPSTTPLVQNTVEQDKTYVKESCVTPSKNSAPAFQLQSPLEQNQDKFDDMTCNTKAFDFDLPSSTPLVGHLKSTSSAASQPNKQCVNGSYIAEDVKKGGITKQELSILFEASKERYSSSSGSSGQTQGSVCTVGSTTLPPVQQELVEKLAQISANQSDLESSFACLSMAGPVDPFSVELITQLLSHIGYPSKHHLIGLHRFDTDAPALQTNSTAKLGDVKYSVVGELGKGNYARVLKATRDGKPVALKQQRPAWEWEWYIVQELQSRLPPNMMSGFLHMSNGFIYRNGSILESEWAKYGSVLSVVNKLKIAYKLPDIVLALIFATQLTSIVEHLHKCRIIHGDIKPDNFVLFSLPTAELTEPCLKLIDFGRSIDMTLLPEGTTFTTVVTTDGFQCNEMKEGRPWTYQTDLYGLAGSIYCVLFYDYMKVVKKDNKWQLSNKIPRYMKPDLWQKVFPALLNVESCEKLPDLTLLRETLEQELHSEHKSSVNQHIKKLTNAVLNK